MVKHYKEIDLDRKGQAFQLVQRVQEEVQICTCSIDKYEVKYTFQIEMIDGVVRKQEKETIVSF